MEILASSVQSKKQISPNNSANDLNDEPPKEVSSISTQYTNAFSQLTKDEINSDNENSKDDLEDLYFDDLKNMIKQDFINLCNDPDYRPILQWMTDIDEDCLEGCDKSDFTKLYKSTIRYMRKQIHEENEKLSEGKISITLDFPNNELNECLISFCQKNEINMSFIEWLIQDPRCSIDTDFNFRTNFLTKRSILELFSDYSYFNITKPEFDDLKEAFFCLAPALFSNYQECDNDDLDCFLKSVICIFYISKQYEDEDKVFDELINFFINKLGLTIHNRYDLRDIKDFISFLEDM